MHPVTVAFFWHQHQPYYPDDVSGETLMPWVRMHATKDYYGMALHLKEVPEFRCTINLVPSLLVQLQAYGKGRTDRHLDVSRLPADGMATSPFIDMTSGYFERARHLLPRQGERAPWRLRQHYFKDAGLYRGPVDEKNLRFRPADALVQTAR